MGTAMLTPINTPAAAANDLALLGLMQLVSPALPIGAFAWSQGLESAFELGWVDSETDLQQWLEGVLEDGLSRCELPLLVRLQAAWAVDDAEAIAQWNDWLHATRETAELNDEDTRLGNGCGSRPAAGRRRAWPHPARPGPRQRLTRNPVFTAFQKLKNKH